MTLTEYITEAVSKRTTGKYGPDLNKKSILDWLDSNGFLNVERPRIGEKNDKLLETDRKIYFLGPNTVFGSDWVSIHGSGVYELVFWFDSKGDVREIESRTPDAHAKTETPEDALKILTSILK